MIKIRKATVKCSNIGVEKLRIFAPGGDSFILVIEQTAKECVIVDLDGTLADAEHRKRLHKDGKLDWATFESPEMIPHDELHQIVGEVVKLLRQKWPIIYVSGRRDTCYDVTVEWLKKTRPLASAGAAVDARSQRLAPRLRCQKRNFGRSDCPRLAAGAFAGRPQFGGADVARQRHSLLSGGTGRFLAVF